MSPSTTTALVLCGGGSTRFGADKLEQRLGDVTVLEHLLRSLPPLWPVVGVGEPRPVSRAVHWVREDPPDGGPLAGIEAGLAAVTTEVVVVLGGDLPFIGPWVERLVALLEGGDPADHWSGGSRSEAACAQGDDGRDNPLVAAYRASAVRAALPPVTRDGRARLLLDAVAHTTIRVPEADLLDVDTPAALAVARARVAG